MSLGNMNGTGKSSGSRSAPSFTVQQVIDALDDFDEPFCEGSDDDLSADELEETNHNRYLCTVL